MIVFDLRCANGHVSEAWFGSGADYEEQKARGLLSCPVCDSHELEKAAMAPAVPEKSNRVPTFAAQKEAVVRLRRAVEANCDYVGEDFASEARSRHEGATPARGVWGEARLEDVRALLADDIPVLPLPFRAPGKTDA